MPRSNASPDFNPQNAEGKSRTMLVDVIICTFNRSNILSICLDALLPQITPSLQQIAGVLVVNNNSQDNTLTVLQELQKLYPFLRITEEHQQGLSHARNCAAVTST